MIIPELVFDLEKACHEIVEGNIRGKISWIIVTAEGAASAPDVAAKISQLTSLEARAVVLGHIQRGGRPTAASRSLALRLGGAAVERLVKGEADKAVAVTNGEVISVGLEQAVVKKDFKVEQVYKLIKKLT